VKKQTKLGLYSAVLSVIVIAAAILINMIASALPSRFTKLETDGLDLYEISKETKDIIKDIDTDIDIYLVAAEGYEDAMLVEFIQRYVQQSKHISYKLLDPGTTPSLKTASDTEHALSEMGNNTVIVSSSLRDKTITESEIFTSDYTEEEVMMYQMYGQQVTNNNYFNGEQMLTSALDYVTLDMISTVYYTVDHGEDEFGSIMSRYVSLENYKTEELSLILEPSIPENASAVVINSPKMDMTEDELALYKDYIDNGGKIILFSDYTNKFESFENFAQLTEYYGMKALEGRVIENDGSMKQGDEFLYPAVNQSHPITSVLASVGTSNPVLLRNPVSGFVFTEDRPDNVVLEKLISTSEEAQTAGTEDAEGNFEIYYEGEVILGAVATLENGGSLAWYSSSELLNESYVELFPGGALTALMTLQEFTHKDTTVSLAAKLRNISALTVDENAKGFWSTVLTTIIPSGIVILGLFVWYLRRRR